MHQESIEGFSLIELMIVIAIIAILGAIALPAYQDFTVRAKLTELFLAGNSAKVVVTNGFHSQGLAGVTRAANEYNARPVAEKRSKFVANIQIDPNLGVIEVTSASANAGLPSDAQGKTLLFTPNVQNAQITAAVTEGAMDWACASTTHSNATNRGLTTAAGTLPAKYAPAECR